MASGNKKQVRVHGKYRPSQSRCLGAPGKEVPCLNVSGEWLKQAGFSIGRQLEITVTKNQLVINPVEHGDTSN